MHRFVVPGIPRPKGRPRFARKTGHAYTPRETEAYESLVRLACGWNQPPLEGPVAIEITALFPYPKSWPKYRRAQRWHTSRPDRDNIVKSVLDALNGVVWRDDAQVAWESSSKQYTDDQPGLLVTVWEMA